MTCHLRIFLIALFAVPLFSSDLFAQRPFERLQRDLENLRPRGRILREIFGDKNDDSDNQQAQENPKRRGTPTPARRKASTQPRPGDQPTAQSKVSSKAKRHPERLEILVRESAKPEGLVVDKINKSGAAWAAGIRKGDLISKVGGIKTHSKEDIGGIIGILKNGDQIEFEFQRNGKTQTAIVQLGDHPEESDSVGIENSNDIAAPNRSLGRLNDDYSQPRYRNSNSLKSVLDGALTPNGSSRTSRPSAMRPLQPAWQVQPPNAGRSRTQPAYQKPASSEIIQLQRELEMKQREVEQLRNQLREATQNPPVTTPPAESEPELDSLLDFDRQD